MIATATVQCSRCLTRYEVPVQSTAPIVDERGHAAVRLFVDQADTVLLRLFAEAHAGPIEAVQ